MKDEIYKDLFKLVNLVFIISCWLINYLFMFCYHTLEILVGELIVFILINIILFVVCKVCE